MHKEKGALTEIQTGLRLLRLVQANDPTYIPLCLLGSFLEIFMAFFTMFLSAALIDALLGGAFERAFYLAGILLIVDLLVGLSRQVVKKHLTLAERKSVLCPNTLLREKLFSLDYETAQSPETLHRLSYLQKIIEMHGGPMAIVYFSDIILRSLVTLLLSVGLVASLCIQKPEAGDGLVRRLAAPGASTVLFAVFLCGLMLSLTRAKKYFDGRYQQIILGHVQHENALQYLVGVAVDYQKSKIIRIFSMEDMLKKNLRTEEGKLHDFFATMLHTGRGWTTVSQLITSLFLIASYLLVILKILAGAVTVGAFTRYTGALTQFASAFGELARGSLELRTRLAYMKEFVEFLDQESGQPIGTLPVEKRLDGEYELCFEDVSFHYPGSSEEVLSHVTCRLDMKGKMAVVGRNGAGKTTFIKLLCRLYEPTGGRITLNGIDIRKYDADEYRSLFGVVFQDFQLFAFPVWENLAAGQEVVAPRDEKRLWAALKQAGADELVQNMPEGLDTFLYKDRQDGVDISGGEAQKLALARALYKDAPIVVLDEPTAALDPISEAEVYARFDQMVKDKTSIYISHRMSSCRFCNDILVFDGGGIVERGSHEELLAKEGLYAGLWRAQARYYQEYAGEGA